MMRHTLPRHVSGERVLVALLEARPAALSTAQLAAATGLSINQVRTGMRWVKDVGAAERGCPLTYSRRDGGYQFPDDVSAWVTYEVAQCHMHLTGLTRLITGTAGPHHAALPDDNQARLMLDQLNGVRASLEVLTRR